jgi:Mce-associated membrane protein
MTDPAPDRVDAPRTPAAVWIVMAVLAAGLVFTSTLAVIQWRRAGDLRHTESLRRTAASTAANFGVALYSYDYNDLAAAKAKVLQYASPAYAKGYAATSPPQQETIVRLKAKESAKAAGVFLTDVVGGRVAAVVILDTTLQSAAGNRTSISYLDVALLRQGSTWKVDTAKPVTVAS